jgi:DsbC/DsbD-like thiol-disulfide interchange protein
MTRSFLCATALASILSPAHAADPVGTPVTATLIEGWQQADGTRMSAVHLTLADGWKTYWRAPGDAGIPPLFDWRGSRNLAGVTIDWPTPQVFGQNGMRSVGYAHQVTLPLSVAPQRADQPVEISLTLEIGVCKDICVPQTLTLEGTLATGGAIPVPAIAAALAERPFSAQEAGAGTATCTLVPVKDGLRITANLTLPPAGGEEYVVIEAGRADVWVSEATSRRNGSVLTAQADMVASGGGAFALDRSAIRFTVLGTSHAVDLRGCTSG